MCELFLWGKFRSIKPIKKKYRSISVILMKHVFKYCDILSCVRYRHVVFSECIWNLSIMANVTYQE